jgi:hypothetical protein
MAQQPFREECCNGYAPLLVSAPCGLVSRRRVRCDPLRMEIAGRGFLLCPLPVSTVLHPFNTSLTALHLGIYQAVFQPIPGVKTPGPDS